MARYRFEALNADGVMLSGDLAAESEREAARTLERRGLAVVSLVPATAPRRKPATRQRLRLQDMVLAFHELATMLNAGVALVEAVSAQARSAAHPRIAAAFDGIATGLKRGQPFTEALTASGLPLPAYFATLVRAGEQAGMLAQVLRDGVAQMEYEDGVRKDIRHALTYPTILVLAGLGAVVMMFTFVVPRFASLLARAQELPWLASAVLHGGMFAREHFVAIASALAAASVIAVAALRREAVRARLFDRLERLPVLGAWWTEAETARWAKVLSTLLVNRVPLMDALALALSGIRAPGRRARMEEAARAVRGGSTLADALEEQATLSATGYNLVRVGERAGELPAMLQSLAKLCEDAGRSRMRQFLALLEPLAILVIGGMIGLIMVGIILAITSANDIVL